jgi:hypothetical protein
MNETKYIQQELYSNGSLDDSQDIQLQAENNMCM